MVADRHKRGFGWAVLLTAALALSGCATSVGEMPIGGPPADAPPAPKDPGAYLPVHDLPPARSEPVISSEELAKIESDLIHARDHQASATSAAKDAKDKGAANDKATAHDKATAKRKPVESRAED